MILGAWGRLFALRVVTLKTVLSSILQQLLQNVTRVLNQVNIPIAQCCKLTILL